MPDADTLNVFIEHDPDVDSPMDDDGQWTLHSFGRRHKSYRDPETLGLSPQLGDDGLPTVDDADLRAKLDSGLAFFCSYYEHGLCRWSLIGEGPRCPWDSIRVAGLLVWDHAEADMGAKTHEDRARDARVFLETYTAWCNGETYWYRVEDAAGNVVDSCGGFVGPDVTYMIESIRDSNPGKALAFKGDLAYLAEGK